MILAIRPRSDVEQWQIEAIFGSGEIYQIVLFVLFFVMDEKGIVENGRFQRRRIRAKGRHFRFTISLPSSHHLQYYAITILSSPDEKVDTVYSLQIASSKPRPLFLFDFPDKWKEKGIESEKAWLVRN